MLVLVAACLAAPAFGQTVRPPYSFSVRNGKTNTVYSASFDSASEATADAVRFLNENDPPSGKQACHVLVVKTLTFVRVVNHLDKGKSIKDFCNDNIFTDDIWVQGVEVGYNIGKNTGSCDCDDGKGSSEGTSPGTMLKGDPINVATGNKYEQDTDYAAPDGRLTFRRFYNSAGGGAFEASAFNGVWRHSFERTLELLETDSNGDATVVRAYRPDGRSSDFNRSSDGSWRTTADVHDTLVTHRATDGTISTYSLTFAASQEVETYLADGRLSNVRDAASGQAILTMAYSDGSTPSNVAPKANLLIAVTDAGGRSLHLWYDDKARLTFLVLPDGNLITYGYPGTGRQLTSVLYPDGARRQFLYNEPDLSTGSTLVAALTGTVDERGLRYETTTYDASGRATSTMKGQGADKISVDYTQAGPEYSRLTGPLGVVTDIRKTTVLGAIKIFGVSAPCGEWCQQPWSGNSYDFSGNLTQRYDFNGNRSTMAYDGNGLVTHQVEAVGSAQERSTDLTWDGIHRVPLTQAISTAKGTAVSKAAWSYNARGQMTAECAIDPSVTVAYTCGSQPQAPNGIRQSTLTYCDAVDSTQCPLIGLLLYTDGPRNDIADVTRYRYYMSTDESGCGNPGGACHHIGDLYQVSDAMNHVSTVLAYDKNGRVARQRDPNGVITDSTYTSRGWIETRTVRTNTNGSASAGDAVTTVRYDPTGTVHSVTDADGVTLTYAYDDAHRLIDVADSSHGHVHFTLDAGGNIIREEAFDAADRSRRLVTRSFNTLGQLVTVKDGLGKTIFDATAPGSYDGNGNLVQSKGALGAVRQDKYDALNRRVTSIANVNGTDAATTNTTTKFAFDPLDQLTGITDPDGLVTTYGFDGLRNPVSLTSPDTGSASTTFDSAGHPVTHTDAKGTVASTTLDALGRATSVNYTDATLNVSYYFDEADGVSGCSGSYPVGRLTRTVEAGVTTTYCYDNQGRLSEQRQTLGAITDTTGYAHTSAGRLAAIATPSGSIIEYGRDAQGQIASVTVTPVGGTATKVVSNATYLPFGPVLSYTLGEGQVLTRTYDANYRVTDVTSPMLFAPVARDAAGNITTLGSSAGINYPVETYSYDPLYRLTSVNTPSGAAIESYTYSKAGDRLSKTSKASPYPSYPGAAIGTYVYKPGTHWLMTSGPESRSYDANGSMTAAASVGWAPGYTYDGRGRLTRLEGTNPFVSYTYNALDQRVAKAAFGGSKVRFTYDETGQLLGEYGSASRDYVWMDEIPVGTVDGIRVAFVHADALGTPRAVTDSNGGFLWTWWLQSNPFGESQPYSFAGYELNLRFPGQYYDIESNLVYNGHRYYDPGTGRYLQSDPIGLRGGISTYAYVENDPLGKVDSTGLSVDDRYQSIDQAGIAAVTDVLVPSVLQNREFAGVVYRNWDGTFSYTQANRGGEMYSFPGNAPWFHEQVAIYHTHGQGSPYKDTENFSTPNPDGIGDTGLSDKLGIPNYLGTSRFAIKKYDPCSGQTIILRRGI